MPKYKHRLIRKYFHYCKKYNVSVCQCEFGGSSCSTSESMSKYIRISKIISTTVKVKPAEVMDGIIELIPVNSRPFTLLEDLGFQKAFDSVMWNRLWINAEST